MSRERNYVPSLLASSIAAGALVWCASANAQTASEAPAASAGGGLDEIIVTAQRRGQNMQDVPIAVNVLSADQLQAMGGASSEDLTLIPGVVYNPSVAGGGISIRGISGTNGGTDEPGNAVYIDGVYQYAASSTLFQFNSIERIEVLKGPQGTLFGRNTAGGVIQVITRDPGREVAAEGEVGYANYETFSGKFYVSVPLSDTLAANLAAYGSDQNEGWGRNVVTGNDVHLGYSWGVRGKIKWVAPSGNTDVVLSAVYSKEKPIASAAGTIAPGSLTVLGEPSPGIFNSASEFDEFRTLQQHTFAATIHQDLGFARLTSITARDRVEAEVFTDGDQTALPILSGHLFARYKTFTQEIQLQSNEDSKLEWIVGGFYMNAETAGRFEFSGVPFIDIGGSVVVPATIKTRSYAGFGQATYPITDSTKITAGIRYTSDKRRLNSFLGPSSKTDSKPSWRLAIDHKFSPDVLGYASYSRGFKGGVFNATSPDKPPADPTSLDAYEVGLKSTAFDRRLRMNAAVFYYRYRGVQIELFDPVTAGAFFANAGAARSYGLDLDIAAEPVDNLTLTGSLSLLDAKFNSSTEAPCYTLPTPPAGGVIRGTCPLDGKRLPFSPKLAISLGANYKHETAVGHFIFSGNYHHNSGYFVDASNFALSRTKAFDMVNASLTWTSSSERLSAGVWGKNLLDQTRIAGALLGSGVAGTVSYPMAPRTYGVTLGFKY